MESLRDALIKGFKAGTFIQTVYSLALADRDDRNVLAANLASLHNEGAIDVIAEFTSFKNEPDAAVDFFHAPYFRDGSATD